MTTSVLSLPVDSWVDQAATGRNHGSTGTLYLSANANARYAYMSFAGLPPATAQIASAILRLFMVPNSWSGQTITVRRLTERWAESGVTWANKPASVATNAVTSGVIGSSTTYVDIDVTALVRDAINAGQRFGFRLETNGTTLPGRPVYSSEAGSASKRPTLTVVWSTKPSAATDLWPAGGQAVSVAAPVVGWTFKDLDGDDQGTYRVQVDDATDFATPLFDSGQIASADPQADLAALGWAGLAANAVAYWRVQVWDAAGNQAPWSDPVQFTRKTKGTVAITAPTSVVESDSPLVAHTFTAGGGGAQESTRYRVDHQETTGAWTQVYDSGRMTTAATTFEIPEGKITREGHVYRITLDVWDTADRATTPRDLPQVTATQQFTFTPGGPAPVTSLVVAQQPAGAPGLDLTWSRSSIPDTFALQVDGVIVVPRIDPLAIQTTSTTYKLTTYAVPGWAAHTVAVLAGVETAGKLQFSATNPKPSITPQPLGIWFVDDAATPPVAVQIFGLSSPDLAVGESSEVFRPVGRSDPVIVRDSMGGLEGSVAGTTQSPADFEAIGDMIAGGRVVRYIVGRVNVPVQLRALGFGAKPQASDLTDVAVEVYQVGEFVW